MRKLLLLLLTMMSLAVNAQTFSGNTVAEEGAWCWFADPRALHYENASGTINATYIGYIDYHGSIKATQIDWKTKTTNEVLIRSWFQPDDHDNPAFLVLPDERIMIIYSRHTDEACFYYRISKRPGDITCLGDEKRLATANNTTYPNPYILSDDPDHIYMCWRGIGWHPTVAQMSMPDANDNIKFTWGPKQMVQSTGARPYAKYMSNGKDKIYLAYTTGHPDNEYPNWLYCDVFNVNDKCLYDLNGKKLKAVDDGTFAVSKTDSYRNSYPSTVVDATADRRDWIWNMAFDKKGNPVIGMTKISNDKQNHDYYYAHWTGSKWNVNFIANGGKYFHLSPQTENCYSSGMAIDRDEPNIVYCGVPVNGVHEIWKYTLDSNDKVVSSEAVTKNSKKSNARPFVIEGTKNAKDGADNLRLSWMYGDYYYWIVNTTYKTGYPTCIMAETALPNNANEPSHAGFTVGGDITINPEQYEGGIMKIMDGVEYGVDEKQYAYLTVNGKTYKSANVLGTADSWQTENTATTGGQWFSKTKLGKFNLTVTYDDQTKRLTVYRNGIIDMQVDYEGSLQTNPEWGFYGKCTVHNKYYEGWCYSQDKIKALVAESEIQAVSVPSEIVTDIVLPTKTASGRDIVWTSSNEDIISNSGIVNLPKSATEVVLSANVAGVDKEYKVKVLSRDIKNNLRANFQFEGSDKGITLMGSAKLKNGKLDLTSNTANFASNGYALVDAGLLNGLRSYTVVLTVTPSSLNKAPRLYDFGAGSGNSLFLRASALSAGIKYNGGTTTMVNSSSSLSTGKEYKLAVTFDASTKTTRIYIDGEESVSGTANQNEAYMIYEAAGDARNYIGRTQWWDGAYAADNQDFCGTIDDFMVYDIALTQKEICNLQNIPFQDKEYATELINADFEGAYSVMAGSGVTSDRAIYIPEGWNVDYSVRNENDFNALKNGDLYYSDFFAKKTQNANGGKQTMWIRQRWGDSNIGMSQTIRPEEGKYTLSVDMFASDTNDGICVFVGKTQKKVSQANKWQTIEFELESDGEEPFEIGLRCVHTGSEAERIAAFDNFVLTKQQAEPEDPDVPDAILAPVDADAPVVIYDLTGRKVRTTLHGIYIQNGKKVVK